MWVELKERTDRGRSILGTVTNINVVNVRNVFNERVSDDRSQSDERGQNRIS